jgi:hypothetical protein
MKRATFWLAVFAMAWGGALYAQEDDDAGHGVARISLLGGDVSVRRGDSGDWVAAALNAPMVTDDTLSTGAGARAEVQFDNANMIRVAGDSEIRLVQLEDERYVLQIARGAVTFRVLGDTRADVELDTPCVSVRPLGRGAYRITVRDDGQSEITVRSGEAEIFTPAGAERLRPGRTMEVRGSAADPQVRMLAEIRRDSWDEWNVSRDRRLESSRSYRYADRTIYGVEDLDDYGTWITVSSYGYVWRPRVAVGWSPYYYGRWVWVDYYGWTWLSYDPWGWAPYHYGRWFWDTGYGWCWWPGGYGIRHRWSPALVAFFGYGHGGVGIGFGFGRVGWVPLGPHEPYHRWYGRGFYRGYRDGFPGDHNRVQPATDLRRNYRPARAPNGIAGMDAAAFGRGGSAERPRPGDVTRAGLVRGMLPVAPGRESLRLSDREASRATIRPAVAGRPFAARTQIRREDRVSFDEQRRAMERGIQNAATGRGIAGNAGAASRPGSQAAGPGRGEAAVPAPNRAGDNAVRPGQDGWRRLGDGAAARAGEPRVTGGPGAATRPAEQPAPGGWRTFPGATARTGHGDGARAQRAPRRDRFAAARARDRRRSRRREPRLARVRKPYRRAPADPGSAHRRTPQRDARSGAGRHRRHR